MQQQPDTKPGNYYVSVVRGKDSRLLLGPFANDHAAALEMVDAVRKKAEELDAKAHWYAFGTCRLEPDDDAPAGILNKFFNAAMEAA